MCWSVWVYHKANDLDCMYVDVLAHTEKAAEVHRLANDESSHFDSACGLREEFFFVLSTCAPLKQREGSCSNRACIVSSCAISLAHAGQNGTDTIR